MWQRVQAKLKSATHPDAGDLDVEPGLVVRASCWGVARVAPGADGGDLHPRLLHTCHREVVHCSANSLAGVRGVHGIETDFAYMRLPIEMKRDKANNLVAGSYIFSEPNKDYAKRINKIR